MWGWTSRKTKLLQALCVKDDNKLYEIKCLYMCIVLAVEKNCMCFFKGKTASVELQLLHNIQ